MNDEELPPVLPFIAGAWDGPGVDTVYLDPPPPVTVMNCQACGTEMPMSQLFSFEDDDNEFFACKDTDACNARVKAEIGNPLSHSFLFDAVNRLAERVGDLEQWRAEMGAATAEPVVGALAPAPTTESADEWVKRVAPSWVQGCSWCESEQHVCPVHRPPKIADPDVTKYVMGRIGTVGNTLVRADARAVPMDDESVDLIVTSPPYWAQRSYTDTCPDCAERAKAQSRNYMERYCPSCGEIRSRNVCPQCNVSTLRTDKTKEENAASREDCPTCGGKGSGHYRGQIGDEPTSDEFLDNLIECTRDWMRVLKPSGSIWVNLGDKYSTGDHPMNGSGTSSLTNATEMATRPRPGRKREYGTVRHKSLLGLPWRYALRCIDELGLILREEVIWSKPNGMPESVTDRCRRSHEQWFHFTKRPDYYSAVDRIRLQDSPGSHKRGANASVNPNRTDVTPNSIIPTNPLGALPPSVWDVATAGLTVPEWLGVDHYAAFPMELPRRIIQGFAPIQVCTMCGEGRRPVKSVTREGGRIRQKVDQRFLGKPKPEGMSPMSQDAIGAHAGYKTWHSISGEACACTPYTDHPGVRVGVEARSSEALVPGNTPRSLGAPSLGPWREYHLDDWEPPPSRPGVVLDPFGGTGTTVLVAEMHGRHGVHLDLSADYLRIAEWRTSDPAQRAAAILVPKPPVQIDGQLSLLDSLGENENDSSDQL